MPPQLTALLSAFLLASFLAPEVRAGDRPSLALSAGEFGTLDDHNYFELGLEYRFPPQKWGLAPIAGLTLLEQDGFYTYGGLRYELPIAARFYVAPSLSAGLYEEGGGKDLGGPIEFRSMLEVGCRVGDRSRVGVGFYHISNSSIYEENGGSESLLLTYSIDV